MKPMRPKRRSKWVPKICVLQVPGRDTAYVNPMLVRMLYKGKGYTRIEFEKGHNVDVSVDQVRRALDAALNADQP
jgi:hypothetical protein